MQTHFITDIETVADAMPDAIDLAYIMLDTEKPVQVYRKFSKQLQALAKDGDFQAQMLLRDLNLEITTPWNEVINPGWKDSYTGEELSLDEIDEHNDFTAATANTSFESAIFDAYMKIGKPEMIGAALNASRFNETDNLMEYVEEQTDHTQDREFDGGFERNYGFAGKSLAEMFQFKLGKLEAEGKVWVKYDQPARKQKTMDWCPTCKIALMPSEVLFIKHQRTCVRCHQESIVKPIDEEFTRIFKPSMMKITTYERLQDWFFYQLDKLAKEYGEFEVAIAVELTGVLFREFIADHRLAKIAEIFNALELEVVDWIFEQEDLEYQWSSADDLDENDLHRIERKLYPTAQEANDPKDTWAFMNSYISAIAGGASAKDAHNFGWNSYRRSVSPAGAEAFSSATGSNGKKWAAFYQAARAAGDITEKVVSIKPSGLVLQPSVGQNLTVNWRWAKQHVPALDHDKDDLIRLGVTIKEHVGGRNNTADFLSALRQRIQSFSS